MKFGKRKFLGLTMGDRSLVAAEVYAGNKSFELKQAVEWSFPDGVPLGEPLGKALRQFLRSSGISATRAVVGIPANWFLVKEKTTPPAGPATLAGLLRLEAERDFSFPPAELVLDYIETAVTSDSSHRLLLLAAFRDKIESLQQMMRAAGLKPVAVTPNVLALAGPGKSYRDIMVLYLGRREVELMLCSGGMPAVIRSLGAASPGGETATPDSVLAWTAGLAGEAGRVLMLFPRREGFVEPQEIAVWDDYGLTEPALQALKNALHLPVAMRKVADISPETGTNNGLALPPCSAATRLALAGANPQGLATNFLRSRIAVTKKPLRFKALKWVAVGVGVLLLVSAVGLLDLHHEARGVAKLRQRLNEMQPEVSAAHNVVDRVQLARTWKSQGPRFLECLREITMAFPGTGRIWTTSLVIRADLKGVVSGKAADDNAVLELLDRLKQNPNFSEANLVYIHEAGGDTHEVVYMINFQFVPFSNTANLQNGVKNDTGKT